ncbi:AsnC family transcriptional regulator [Streptomyces humi]
MYYGGPTVWLDKRLTAHPATVGAGGDGAKAYGPAGLEDEPLITALERDGRTPLAELVKLTGGSETAVRRRLDQLLARGDLFFDIQYDPRVLGAAVRALLQLRSVPLADVDEYLADCSRGDGRVCSCCVL